MPFLKKSAKKALDVMERNVQTVTTVILAMIICCILVVCIVFNTDAIGIFKYFTYIYDMLNTLSDYGTYLSILLLTVYVITMLGKNPLAKKMCVNKIVFHIFFLIFPVCLLMPYADAIAWNFMIIIFILSQVLLILIGFPSLFLLAIIIIAILLSDRYDAVCVDHEKIYRIR